MNPKRKKYVIITFAIIILMLSIILFLKLHNQNTNLDNEQLELEIESEEKEIEDEIIEEVKKPYIMTYEELKSSKSIKSDNSISNTPGAVGSSSNINDSEISQQDVLEEKDVNAFVEDKINITKIQPSTDNEIILVDESSETMIDETIKNEYKGEIVQDAPYEFFEVQPSGKSVNGHIEPGGQEHIGKWN